MREIGDVGSGLGALTQWCPPSLVDRVIERCGRTEVRRRRLSARSMVFFELARCLYPDEGYRQVFEELTCGEGELVSELPNKSSLCRARRRLGPRVLRELFREVAGPMAQEDSCPSAFWRGLRVQALDATLLDLADTPENERAFGRPTAVHGTSAYPQAKVMAMVECGSRAVVDAVVGGYRDAEAELALDLVESAGPGTLVLGDRNFMGTRLWSAFREGGAQLLWRLKKNVARSECRELGDGSYLAVVGTDSKRRAELRRKGIEIPVRIEVRVIEYTLDGEEEVYRLATSLLDPATAPAAELAALYHWRWQVETIFSELKIVQRTSRTVLRSQHPDGVLQEIWANLTVHHLTRDLIHHAATVVAPIPLDPDRISFRRAQHLVRRSLAESLSPLRTRAARAAGRRPARGQAQREARPPQLPA
ncbi:IS4 family transposase [Streptacidiphilus sp. PAMC 29251]